MSLGTERWFSSSNAKHIGVTRAVQSTLAPGFIVAVSVSVLSQSTDVTAVDNVIRHSLP